MKVVIFMTFIYLLRKIIRRKPPPLEADIVISPGGYRGIYVAGICHYVKNHFDIQNKTFAGFSSGSFNSLFMVLDKEQDNAYLQKMFALKKGPIHKLLRDVIHTVSDHFTLEQFDLARLQIAVSTTTGLEYFKQFLTLQDVLACCKCSSFVPFLTHSDIFMIYRNKLTLDGAIFYRDVKKQRRPDMLFLDANMFGRYKPNRMAGFIRPKESVYQMYINGYHDARKNHAYFDSYLQPLIHSS